jgi:hypothetical protein
VRFGSFEFALGHDSYLLPNVITYEFDSYRQDFLITASAMLFGASA